MTANGSQRDRDESAAMRQVYVSITGLKLKARRHQLRFWWHALRSFSQARKAAGNISIEARLVNGIHHTRTVWVDETAMRRYVSSGAHLQAMKDFANLATGKTFGFYAKAVPEWHEIPDLWTEWGRPATGAREVGGNL